MAVELKETRKYSELHKSKPVPGTEDPLDSSRLETAKQQEGASCSLIVAHEK